MRRYQYRLNDQNVSMATWGKVTPLKYMEAVPGDTFGGTITVKATSAVQDKVIHSRAYYDLYAFYCPIRVLWPQFPQFLAGHEGDVGTGPVTTTLFPQNFEHSFVGDDSPATDNITPDNGVLNKNSALLRRMYYMVCQSFFCVDRTKDARKAQQAVEDVRNGANDDTVWLFDAAARESTLDESWNNYDEDEGVQITTDASGNFTLDQVRRAYSLDRFEKMRDFYGSRYTDILKGYGIKADWGILQEPECIGLSNNDFRFVQKSQTDTSVGNRKGFFEGEYKLKLRKTFCPEHGIIGVFAVPRADVFNENYAGHVIGSRTLATPSTWYDPVAWSGYNSQSFPKRLIDHTAARGDRAETALGEHLRKGRNEHAIRPDSDWSKLPVFSRSMTESLDSPAKWRNAICNPDGTESTGERIDVAENQIVHFTEVRVTKRSPVKPAALTTMR